MAKNYDLFLQGPVGGWDFDATYVDYILDKFSEREVSVLIDSLGGKTNTALSICASFVNHGNVTVHFQGMNASAATIASMGAKKITIEDSATYLVHKCSLEFFDWSMKNADQLESYIEQLKAHKEDLDKIDAHIAELYARRCKKEPSALLALMKKGGWLTPAEAKAWGFVDEIVSGKEKKPIHISSFTASAMSDAGISLPPGVIVDFTEEPSSWMRKFFDNLSNIFNKSSQMEQNKNQEPHAQQGGSAQSAAQEQTQANELDSLRAELEAEKKAHADEVAKLKSKLEESNKQPAASSSQVIEQSKTSKQEEQPSMVEAFVKTTASAKELFDSLP